MDYYIVRTVYKLNSKPRCLHTPFVCLGPVGSPSIVRVGRSFASAATTPPMSTLTAGRRGGEGSTSALPLFHPFTPKKKNNKNKTPPHPTPH